MKREVQSRDDIKLIVQSFYDAIKKNELLGPVFTGAIPENEWMSHIEKLTDVWDSAVFGSMTFKGNPSMTHAKLDKSNKHGITQDHFAVWLENWNATLDASWEGSKVEEMKIRFIFQEQVFCMSARQLFFDMCALFNSENGFVFVGGVRNAKLIQQVI